MIEQPANNIEVIHSEADAAYTERMGSVASGIVDALMVGLTEDERMQKIEHVLSALRPLDDRLCDFDKNVFDERRF